jgi:predicted transcriptional regulator of viral defense system
MPGLASLSATFTTGEAVAHGVHPRDLYAARDSGAIIELSRGVFRQSEASLATYPDFLAVARRAPRAVVCLVSAAAVHDLTDEIPAVVQIAVPSRAGRPISRSRRRRFSGSTPRRSSLVFPASRPRPAS